jgi:hypothetical protein
VLNAQTRLAVEMCPARGLLRPSDSSTSKAGICRSRQGEHANSARRISGYIDQKYVNVSPPPLSHRSHQIWYHVDTPKRHPAEKPFAPCVFLQQRLTRNDAFRASERTLLMGPFYQRDA